MVRARAKIIKPQYKPSPGLWDNHRSSYYCLKKVCKTGINDSVNRLKNICSVLPQIWSLVSGGKIKGDINLSPWPAFIPPIHPPPQLHLSRCLYITQYLPSSLRMVVICVTRQFDFMGSLHGTVNATSYWCTHNLFSFAA